MSGGILLAFGVDLAHNPPAAWRVPGDADDVALANRATLVRLVHRPRWLVAMATREAQGLAVHLFKTGVILTSKNSESFVNAGSFQRHTQTQPWEADFLFGGIELKLV